MLVTNLLLLASLVLAAPVPIIEFDPTSLGYLNLYLEHFTKIMNERIPSYSISEKFDPIQVLDSGSIKSTVDLGVCNADAEIGFTLKNLVGLKNFRFAEFKMLSGGFFDDGDERGFRTTDSLKGLPTNVTVEIEGFVGILE